MKTVGKIVGNAILLGLSCVGVLMYSKDILENLEEIGL